jgi:hypothetical protein
MRQFLNWETFREAEMNPNILERDYQLKLAMGFSRESFTHIGKLQRRPATEMWP